MSDPLLRTIEIPRKPAPSARRRERVGDVYPCIVCGIPVTTPKYTCHVIGGGGKALHRDDEDAYMPDGGDLGHYPVGTDCLRQNPQMKEYVHKVAKAQDG